MATLRGTTSGPNLIGSAPPEIIWTIVRGDTATFKAFVTDDSEDALYIPDWTIKVDIKRNGLVVASLTPQAVLDPIDDESIPGEFLVKLTSVQSKLLESGDIFDIQMTNISTNAESIGFGQIWTVAIGSVSVIEDVTT
jgi:hypothetical protein